MNNGGNINVKNKDGDTLLSHYCFKDDLEMYIMVKQANRDLEYSCDDLVIKNSDMNFRKEYSLIILKAMKKGKTTTLSTYLLFSESTQL